MHDSIIEFDLTFPHHYEVEQLGELPGTGKFAFRVLYFPPPKGRPERAGIWLKVKAESGKSWIGVFAFASETPATLSRIVSTPDVNRVCVISKGAAYIVKVDDPDVWEEITVMPVLEVRSILESNLLVFSDFTRLSAYGSAGVAWRSPRVCWDDLKIVTVTGNTIEGVGYDPTNSTTHESRFVVDLRTGRSLLPSPTSNDGKSIW
jgi:hypothetical protein